MVCQTSCSSGGTHLEAHNEAVLCCGCHIDITLADLTHGLVDDIDLNLLCGEFDEGVAEGFDRAVHIALDDEVEFLYAAQCDVVCQLFQAAAFHGAKALLACQLFALVGNLSGFLVGVHDMESIAGLRCTVEAEHRSRLRRANLLDTLSALVEHSLDTSVVRSGKHDISYAQSAVADEHCCHITATLVQAGLDDGACCFAVGVCLEVKHLCLKQYLLKQFGHADALLCADILALVLAAPFLDEEVHGCKPFLNLVGVCTWLVYLVDGEDDGHVSCGGVCNGLLGLGHDVVVVT